LADKKLKQLILNEIATGATAQQCAEKYNVPAGTIRSWLSRAKAKGGTKSKLQHDNAAQRSKKKDATQRKSATKKKSIKEFEITIEDVDSELTEKQRLFCLFYIQNFNATKAAIKAGYSSKTAYSIGYELLNNPEVRKEIERLKKLKLAKTLLGIDDVVEQLAEIGFNEEVNANVQIKALSKIAELTGMGEEFEHKVAYDTEKLRNDKEIIKLRQDAQKGNDW
jgi:phage terminase small subunit